MEGEAQVDEEVESEDRDMEDKAEELEEEDIKEEEEEEVGLFVGRLERHSQHWRSIAA